MYLGFGSGCFLKGRIRDSSPMPWFIPIIYKVYWHLYRKKFFLLGRNKVGSGYGSVLLFSRRTDPDLSFISWGPDQCPIFYWRSNPDPGHLELNPDPPIFLLVGPGFVNRIHFEILHVKEVLSIFMRWFNMKIGKDLWNFYHVDLDTLRSYVFFLYFPSYGQFVLVLLLNFSGSGAISSVKKELNPRFISPF